MSQKETTQKPKMLLIVSIIMFLPAAFSILICFGNLKRVSSIYSSVTNPELVQVASIILLFASALQIIAGIVGIIGWIKPAIAKVCYVLGIILVILIVLGNIIMMANNPMNIVIAVTGSVPAVLYSIGAKMLM